MIFYLILKHYLKYINNENYRFRMDDITVGLGMRESDLALHQRRQPVGSLAQQ